MVKKEEIRDWGYDLGADAVGFAAKEDYRSPKSPDLEKLMPGVRSIIVLGFKELHGGLESPVGRLGMMNRLCSMDTAKSAIHSLGRRIENRLNAKAAPVLFGYPLDMSTPHMGLVGDVSLRHAAIAAGLGVFGRHNLVIHPKFGTRIVFSALLTDLALESDPPVEEDLCIECDVCVKACPAKALDEEGKTNELKCLRVSQPYGIGGAIGFVRKFMDASPEEQKSMLISQDFLHIYQASFIGFQYNCFKCMASCPVGRAKKKLKVGRPV